MRKLVKPPMLLAQASVALLILAMVRPVYAEGRISNSVATSSVAITGPLTLSTRQMTSRRRMG